MNIKETIVKLRNAPLLTQIRVAATPVVIVAAAFEAGFFTSAALTLLWLGAEASDWRQ